MIFCPNSVYEFHLSLQPLKKHAKPQWNNYLNFEFNFERVSISLDLGTRKTIGKIETFYYMDHTKFKIAFNLLTIQMYLSIIGTKSQ